MKKAWLVLEASNFKGGWLVNVVKGESGIVLISKLDGSSHLVPVLAKGKKQPVSHRIPEHIEKMECHSCHAAWTAQDYGLHLVLQESRGYAQWAHLRSQNDPQIQSLLKKELQVPPEDRSPPQTRDWLTGRRSPGAWFAGRTYRGWEGFKTLTALMGHRGFLPDFLTYKWTLILLIAFLLVYYLLATWNEETDKITVEI